MSNKRHPSGNQTINDVHEQLQEQGYEVPTQEELEDKAQDEIKMSKDTYNSLLSRISMLESAVVVQAASQSRNIAHIEQEIEKKIEKEDDLKWVDEIMNAPKINMFIVRKRDPFFKYCIFKTRPMKDSSGRLLLDMAGVPMMENYINININGVDFDFGLGPDLGETDGNNGVWIKVPWPIACVMSDKFRIPIENPETKERYMPVNYTKPVQNPLSENGTWVQSEMAEASTIRIL